MLPLYIFIKKYQQKSALFKQFIAYTVNKLKSPKSVNFYRKVL